MTIPEEDKSRFVDRRWHVAASDGKMGPLTLSEVASLAATGRIAPRSLAWKSGMDTWRPCGTIPELAPLFSNHGTASADAWRDRVRRWLARGYALLKHFIPYLKRLRAWFMELTPRRRAIILLATFVLGAFWIWRSFIYVSPHDIFIGEYLSFDTGRPIPRIQIAKYEGEYQIFNRHQEQWIGPERMRPMTEAELADIFGEEWSELEAMGLTDEEKNKALLKVPLGSEFQNFTPFSGYFLLYPAGPVDLHKGPLKFSLPFLRPKASTTPEPTSNSTPTQAREKNQDSREERTSRSDSATSESNPRTQTSPKLQRLTPTGGVKSMKPGTSGEMPSTNSPNNEIGASSDPLENSESNSENSTTKNARIIVKSKAAAGPSSAMESPACTISRTGNSESSPNSQATLEASASPSSPGPLPPPVPVSAQTSSSPQMTSTPEPASMSELTPMQKATPTDSAQIAAAQEKATAARSRLASMTASGRTTLRDEFVKDGDSFLKTSKEREAQHDADGAIFYAERAEATYRQGESTFAGSK